MAAAILVVALGGLLYFLYHTPAGISRPAAMAADGSSPSPLSTRHPARAPHAGVDAPVAEEEDDSDTNQIFIPREQIERCLGMHPRDAGHLLAAFHLSKDTNYLNEALAGFSSNPQVQLTVLLRNIFPADRRKWLDSFKASSPGNALADYLSAEDYFKCGDTNAALKELLAADHKTQFEIFSVESGLNQEDLAECSGKQPMEAISLSMAGFSEDDLPLIAELKRLAQSMRDLQKQLAAAGDKESAENVAEGGIDLARQIEGGESGKYFINRLVGRAIGSIFLKQLDQNTPYDFLDGKTPAQVQAEMKTEKEKEKALLRAFSERYAHFNDAELQAYAQRMKIYGELAAMKWFVEQHPDNP
jgi:hypothetical protein